MAKSEIERHEAKMKKFKPTFEWIKIKLDLKGTENEMIHQLVDEANKLQKIICEESDKIKIDSFEQAKQLVNIDRKTWWEFVLSSAMKMHKGNVTDKQHEKFNEDSEHNRYITNLKKSFYDSYMNDKELELANEDDRPFDYDTSKNSAFESLLEENAKLKNHISYELHEYYKKLKQAAYFLTDGNLDFNDFKNIVEWQYYKDSEDPKYPCRARRVYTKFDQMYRLMLQYGFDNHLEELNREFGYEIKKRENL